QLPVVFVCDNNQWAYSTPTHLEYACENLADRAQSYGFDGVVVDGTDVLAVYREAKRAIEKARAGGGPTLIECLTQRMEGHAVHDDAFYVPKPMLEEWAKADPIERFRTWLRENVDFTDEQEDDILASVKRVIDAPLSETAIVAGATGAAMMGMRPVAEMQFADFISCAWDHLVTVAAKQRWRVGTPVPITVRLPSGGGFSGGPFHSQNPESSFAHIPGLKCVCPATPEDAKGLLISAIEDPNPVLYFEHKHLYRRIKAEVPEERYTVPLGKARTHREGDDLTVITWGAMVYTADEAAQKLDSDGVSVEIVDLRTVMPWDKAAVLESVRKTSKALVL